MKDGFIVLFRPWASSSKVTIVLRILSILLFLEPLPRTVTAYSASLFQEVTAAQQIFPSKTVGTDIEKLPDFEELFERIQQVSPLAQSANESNNHDKGDDYAPAHGAGGVPRGFAKATDQSGTCPESSATT